MREFDALITEWGHEKRKLATSDDLAPHVLAAVQGERRPPEAFDFRLPNPLAAPICLTIGLFKIAFVVQIAF